MKPRLSAAEITQIITSGSQKIIPPNNAKRRAPKCKITTSVFGVSHSYVGILGILQTAHYRANAGVVYFRVMESTTGYTFTPYLGSFNSPAIDVR